MTTKKRRKTHITLVATDQMVAEARIVPSVVSHIVKHVVQTACQKYGISDESVSRFLTELGAPSRYGSAKTEIRFYKWFDR